jgi:hypothetical protein
MLAICIAGKILSTPCIVAERELGNQLHSNYAADFAGPPAGFADPQRAFAESDFNGYSAPVKIAT